MWNFLWIFRFGICASMSRTWYFSICALTRYIFDWRIQCSSSKLNFGGYRTFVPTFILENQNFFSLLNDGRFDIWQVSHSVQWILITFCLGMRKFCNTCLIPFYLSLNVLSTILWYDLIMYIPYFREQFPRKLSFFEFKLMYCDLW